jgi:serine protease
LKKNKAAASPFRPSYLLAGLLAGPGLFFFAPLVLSRVYLPVDMLARPLGDMDFYVGASLHKWLPFANALVPLGLSVLTFQMKRLRPFVAGIAAGTAAYLGSVVLLHESASPFGGALLMVWCAANAVVCGLIARMHLAETN